MAKFADKHYPDEFFDLICNKKDLYSYDDDEPDDYYKRYAVGDIIIYNDKKYKVVDGNLSEPMYANDVYIKCVNELDSFTENDYLLSLETFKKGDRRDRKNFSVGKKVAFIKFDYKNRASVLNDKILDSFAIVKNSSGKLFSINSDNLSKFVDISTVIKQKKIKKDDFCAGKKVQFKKKVGIIISNEISNLPNYVVVKFEPNNNSTLELVHILNLKFI